jgi:hypothetical protein
MLYYGLAGFILIMAVSFIRSINEECEDFCAGAAIPIFHAPSLALGAATGWLRPATIDGQLRALDLALGLDGFALTRWPIAHQWYFAVQFIYPALPLMMALAAGALPHAVARGGDRRLDGPDVPSRLSGGLVRSMRSRISPFGRGAPGSGRLDSSAKLCPFDAFHLSVPLALNISNWRWRWIFIIYALLIAFATVAGGEHYCIDVVAGIPFTLVVQKLAQVQTLRNRCSFPTPQRASVTT